MQKTKIVKHCPECKEEKEIHVHVPHQNLLSALKLVVGGIVFILLTVTIGAITAVFCAVVFIIAYMLIERYFIAKYHCAECKTQIKHQ